MVTVGAHVLHKHAHEPEHARFSLRAKISQVNASALVTRHGLTVGDDTSAARQSERQKKRTSKQNPSRGRHAQEAAGAGDGHVVAPLLREESNVALSVAAHHAEHNNLPSRREDQVQQSGARGLVTSFSRP